MHAMSPGGSPRSSPSTRSGCVLIKHDLNKHNVLLTVALFFRIMSHDLHKFSAKTLEFLQKLSSLSHYYELATLWAVQLNIFAKAVLVVPLLRAGTLVERSTGGTAQHFSRSTDVRQIPGGWRAAPRPSNLTGTSCMLIVSTPATHPQTYRQHITQASGPGRTQL